MQLQSLLIGSLSLLAVIAGLLLFRVTMHQPEIRSAPAVPSVPDNKIPTLRYEQIRLKDLSGQERALSEWDKPVQVINFWAPWCAPCRREMPVLIELQKTYAEKIQFIGLSFDSVSNVQKFNQEMPINYPLLIVQAESAGLNKFFGNQAGGLPFTAIINAQREIVFRHTGEISRAQLEAQIKPLL